MDTDERQVRGKQDDLTQGIIGIFFDVYNESGYGFLESVYREAMRLALSQASFVVATEVPVPVEFRGAVIGIFRADLIVNQAVLIELKACDALAQEHHSQTLHYLKSTKIEVALLMNFGPTPKFKRLVMNNEMKKTKNSGLRAAPIGVKPLATAEVSG